MYFYTVIKIDYHKGHWIGLSGSASWNNWKWSDRTPFSYSNWREGQPNGKDQQCTYVSKKYKPNPFTFYFININIYTVQFLKKNLYNENKRNLHRKLSLRIISLIVFIRGRVT